MVVSQSPCDIVDLVIVFNGCSGLCLHPQVLGLGEHIKHYALVRRHLRSSVDEVP